MKKAKIMLSAIAIFAVVGGALAFKAAKFNSKHVYCSTTFDAASCSLSHYVASTFPADLGNARFTSYCTNETGSTQPCPEISVSVKQIPD
jgi:hypothetical protein